jgi:NADH-quinone oxidoreductase subunit N
MLMTVEFVYMAGSLLYYTAAYSLSGIAAFSVILYVCKNRDNEDVVNFHGLGKTESIVSSHSYGSFAFYVVFQFCGILC